MVKLKALFLLQNIYYLNTIIQMFANIDKYEPLKK